MSELLLEVPLRRGGVVATSIEQVAVEVVPINYRDDTAVAIAAENATQLLPKLDEAAEVLVQPCSLHELAVKFGTGKTETVIRFAGAGTTEATAALCAFALADDGGDSVPLLPLASSGVLRLVQHYRHLGGVVGQRYGLD